MGGNSSTTILRINLSLEAPKAGAMDYLWYRFHFTACNGLHCGPSQSWAVFLQLFCGLRQDAVFSEFCHKTRTFTHIDQSVSATNPIWPIRCRIEMHSKPQNYTKQHVSIMTTYINTALRSITTLIYYCPTCNRKWSVPQFHVSTEFEKELKAHHSCQATSQSLSRPCNGSTLLFREERS